MNEEKQREHAYRALAIAAERMGINNYHAGYEAHIHQGRKPSTYRYSPTPAHRLIVETMPKVLSGEISANDAMALLHTYDVEKERFGT